MTSQAFTAEVYAMLMAAAILAGPILVVAAGLGLLLGFGQAVTQIQDQTLSMVLKIIVIAVALLALGGRLASPLYDRSVQVFTAFPVMVR